MRASESWGTAAIGGARGFGQWPRSGRPVEFTGTLPFEQIANGYAGSAVVLNPRLRRLPMITRWWLVWARVCVITTDLGDTAFVAEPGREAVFVKAGDERASLPQS